MEWDAIIIGTGMGGSVLGHALARAGQRVLFCEKGKSHLQPGALANSYAETHFPRREAPAARHSEVLGRPITRLRKSSFACAARRTRCAPKARPAITWRRRR